MARTETPLIPQRRPQPTPLPGKAWVEKPSYIILVQAMDLMGPELGKKETLRFSGMEWEAKVFMVRLIYVG